MSKKTSAIYKCLDNLEELGKRFVNYGKKISQNGNAKIDDGSNELDNIDFQFQQELKTLRFWFDSLYKYNGKSTSLSKKNASIRNGRKGGRPPKEISLTKQRILFLQEELLPELDHKIIMADSNEELESLEKQRNLVNDELAACIIKVKNWSNEKK